MNDLALPDLSNITATAILGWYAWHTASRTIPELLRDFRNEIAAGRAEFRAELEAFRQELAAERRERHEDHQAIVEALHELSERLKATEAQASE